MRNLVEAVPSGWNYTPFDEILHVLAFFKFDAE